MCSGVGLIGYGLRRGRYRVGVAEVLGTPRLQVGIEKAFYRKRYSYRSTLLDWARELSAETDLQSLLNRLRRRVRGLPYPVQ